MTKYRIVTRGGLYRIQYKFLFFFWGFYEESVFEELDTVCTDLSYYRPYETSHINEAKLKLLTLRAQPQPTEKWKVLK